MGKILYLDCISGIAGDMTLAALIDLGADPDYITRELRKLPIDAFELSVEPVIKKGISAKQLRLTFPRDLHHEPLSEANVSDVAHAHKHHHDHHGGHRHPHDHAHSHEHVHSHGHGHSHEHVHSHEHGHAHSHAHHHADHHHDQHNHGHGHDHSHRQAAEILSMIAQSDLPSRVKERSTAIFRVIAEAEGKIHGMPPEQVHFHEVGAMDSIIDIIGVCLAMENLDIETIYASPVPTGSGRMRMAHGLYPIPAPATAEILRGIPLSPLHAEGELTTPTGAGILKALCKSFGPIPAYVMDKIGYGAGQKDFAHPNVLRAIVMTDQPSIHKGHGEQEVMESIVVLEAQLDDFHGELFGYVMGRLLDDGALDVYFTPIYMKKNRPGTLITVLARAHQADELESVLLEQTSTFGVRRSVWSRKALGRRWIQVDTKYGVIRVKQAIRNGKVIHSSPEYDDAVQAAEQASVALQTVYEEVSKQLGKQSALQ